MARDGKVKADNFLAYGNDGVADEAAGSLILREWRHGPLMNFPR
jgi:hypothetical protein